MINVRFMKVIEIFPKFLIISITLFAFGSSGFAQSEKEPLFEKLKETVYNFRQVTPNVYRSGLVSKESVPYLKELGIKTVITFDNKLKRVETERAFYEGTGIEFISIPWSGFSDPDDETIQKIHSIMNDPAKQPVLVHCKHGQERTGVTIATWRIAEQNWNADQAYQEMKACGFRPFRYGHLKKYVYDFAKQRGDENAEIGAAERVKSKVLLFIYSFRKLNPFNKS